MTRTLLCDAAGMDRAVAKVAREIADEFCAGPEKPSFVLVGLHKQGGPFAERLARVLRDSAGYAPPVGKLDITMYRDDFGMRSALPLIRETVIPFDLDGRDVVLVDDVLSSGRTIRGALDAVTDYGRPAVIRLAVLVDRGRPEFPIRADYSGMLTSDVPARDKIKVEFAEDGGSEGIYRMNWEQKQ